MSIQKKEFLDVECDKCGEQLSLVDDCGFTVFNNINEAKTAIEENEWEIDEGENILCYGCDDKHFVNEVIGKMEQGDLGDTQLMRLGATDAESS